MSKHSDKRTVDMQVIADWIEPGARVLDLGCGRGVLLDYLTQTKHIQGVGVDLDFGKVSACVRRGVSAFQGDLMSFMQQFPDGHFDHVICSRTIEELAPPDAVLAEALRVGRQLTVGFVNYGYWRNRWAILRHGRKPRNEVFRTEWFASRPGNPVSIADFEHFCAAQGYRITHRSHLGPDWQSPCRYRPNLFAGYALYAIAQPTKA